MSWHFSQALVAAYSAANSSGGRPSALLSGKPIPRVYLSPDRMRAFSRISRFGMTCEPLTDDLGADVLTWCLAASPAKTSAQPEKAPESTESAAECGRTWRESFTRWDHATSSWRTPQCSLLEDLDVFSETWPQWGTMHAGECSEQSMPVLRTSATGFGFWPTPCANETGEKPENLMERMKKYGRTGSEVHMKLSTKVQMWPTPDTTNRDNKSVLYDQTATSQSGRSLATFARTYPRSGMRPTPSAHKQTASGELTNADGSPWDGISKPHSEKTGQPVQTALMDAVKTWLTPRCQMTRPVAIRQDIEKGHRGNLEEVVAVRENWPPTAHNAKETNAPSKSERNTPTLAAQAGGSLNPMWVEWLMGWPLGWTDLKPLETDKYPQWRHSHGGF